MEIRTRCINREEAGVVWFTKASFCARHDVRLAQICSMIWDVRHVFISNGAVRQNIVAVTVVIIISNSHLWIQPVSFFHLKRNRKTGSRNSPDKFGYLLAYYLLAYYLWCLLAEVCVYRLHVGLKFRGLSGKKKLIEDTRQVGRPLPCTVCVCVYCCYVQIKLK